MSNVARWTLDTIFKIDSTKKIPTPTPTVTISNVPSISPAVWVASTVRSGSATVINTPIKKHTNIKTPTLLERESPAPTCSPIGVIAMSAPKLNRPIPTINTNAEIKNTVVSVRLKFTNGVKFNSNTIAVTGNTDTNDSFNLNQNARNNFFSFSLHKYKVVGFANKKVADSVRTFLRPFLKKGS